MRIGKKNRKPKTRRDTIKRIKMDKSKAAKSLFD